MAFAAIAGELQRRGHRVTVFQAEELQPGISARGLDFRPLPSHAFSVQRYVDLVNAQRGISLRNFLEYATRSARMLCEEAPAALRDAGVDGVVVDIAQPGGATAAEIVGLPFVTVCNALPLHSEPDVPPDFLPWRYSDARWARVRNRICYALRDFMIRPLHRVLNGYRRAARLPCYHSPDDSFSPLAQITQLVREFDFPRRRLPECFHYVGPYRREPERALAFPFDRLNGKPLVYASLGTVFGSRMEIWRAIVDGCSGLNVQLVIALGGSGRAESLPELREETIAVDYAPQRELLRRAALAITHGGLNSAMEALAAGAPSIAIPITGDQFGVAARIAYTGAGETLSAAKCSGPRLRAAVRKILSTPAYRKRASVLSMVIQKTEGAAAAAEIIEEAVSMCRPVMRKSVVLA